MWLIPISLIQLIIIMNGRLLTESSLSYEYFKRKFNCFIPNILSHLCTSHERSYT